MRQEVHFEDAESVTAVSAFRGGWAVGVFGARNRLAVLDEGLRLLDEIPTAGVVRSIAASPSQRSLAFGVSQVGTYTLLDWDTRQSVPLTVPSTGWVEDPACAVFLGESELVGIRGWECGVLGVSGTWRPFERKHDHRIYHVSIAADGRLAATKDSTKSLRIWDVARGKQIRRLTSLQFGATAFSPDGTVLAWTGGWGGGVHQLGGKWDRLVQVVSPFLINSPPAWLDASSWVFGSKSALLRVDGSGKRTELDRVEGAELDHVACGPGGIAAGDGKQARLLVWPGTQG